LQKYCACHTKRLSTRYETRLNVTKCHACQVKRSNATCETSKMTPSAKLTIGTAIWSSRGRLRTVADGCEWLRTVANGCERKRNVERTHPQPPDPQSETGTHATHSGINFWVSTKHNLHHLYTQSLQDTWYRRATFSTKNYKAHLNEHPPFLHQVPPLCWMATKIRGCLVLFRVFFWSDAVLLAICSILDRVCNIWELKSPHSVLAFSEPESLICSIV
jgi:hypothetical protein